MHTYRLKFAYVCGLDVFLVFFGCFLKFFLDGIQNCQIYSFFSIFSDIL